MNKIPAYLKKTGRTLLTAMALCVAFSACDGVIYDGDDSAKSVRLKFRYDRNMKWADAFAQEVKSIHLYAFNEEDTLVWQQTEQGDTLAFEDYAMNLDLPDGNYRLVAWGGLENEEEGGGSFYVPEVYPDETFYLEDLQCSLNRRRNSSGAYSNERLRPLFHGMLDVSLPGEGENDRTYTMNLTKNTNHVRVILQHLSGGTVNVKDFNFRIEERNGRMDYDNSLLSDEQITYLPYHTGSGIATLGNDDYPQAGRGQTAAAQEPRAVTSVSVAIADLSIARLVTSRKTLLTIETKDGQTVAQIPLTDYALLLKDYEHGMTDQEYLDRQDEYVLTFFLDEREKWIETSIIINSWKIVLNGVDFGE